MNDSLKNYFKLKFLVGKPIDVSQVDEPTNEQIDALHNTYVESLKILFEQNKLKYGAQDLELNIK